MVQKDTGRRQDRVIAERVTALHERPPHNAMDSLYSVCCMQRRVSCTTGATDIGACVRVISCYQVGCHAVGSDSGQRTPTDTTDR